MPDDRSGRVLDAAAELLVRWGFQRVTIEDVARHAGIGKGTVYLHFRTKEALFVTVLLRAHHGVLTGMADRIDRDPDEALPSHMMRSVYLEVAADPVLRPLYLGDAEILGRLAQEASATLGELSTARDEVVRAQFGLLREAGCVRTDLDVDAQIYALGAIGAGFFISDDVPVLPDVRRRADLLAHSIAALLEVPDRPPGATASIAPAIAEHFRSLITHVDDELRRRVR